MVSVLSYRTIFLKIMFLSIIKKLLIERRNCIRHSRHSNCHTLADTTSKLGHEISTLRCKGSPEIIHRHVVISQKMKFQIGDCVSRSISYISAISFFHKEESLLSKLSNMASQNDFEFQRFKTEMGVSVIKQLVSLKIGTIRFAIIYCL